MSDDEQPITEPTPVDFGGLTAEDAPPIIGGKPDHKASRSSRWKREPKQEQPKTTREKPKKTTPPRRKGQFIEPLENIYATMAITLMPFDPVCANAIAAAAPECAKTLDELAYQNDAVRRMIHSLVNVSAVGAVIAAHLPILLAVAVHHVPAARNAGGVLAMKFTPQPPPTDAPEGETHAA